MKLFETPHWKLVCVQIMITHTVYPGKEIELLGSLTKALIFETLACVKWVSEIFTRLKEYFRNPRLIGADSMFSHCGLFKRLVDELLNDVHE